MPALRRDLLLMRQEINPDPQMIEREVTRLDLLLRRIENNVQFYEAFELLDLNRFKIFRDQLTLTKSLKRNGLKPFQFLVNRN